MKDQYKTKQKLIEELVSLRRQVARLGKKEKNRKRTEEALRESEDRYRSLFSNSLDAVLLTSPDGTILEANAEACRMFGYTEEGLRQIGRDAVVDTSDPRLPIALEERKRTGRFGGGLNLIRKDGTKFHAEISSSVFKDKDGNLRTSMIIRDISDRKQMEEALKSGEEAGRRLATENEILAEISRIISSSLNIEEIYDRFAKEVHKLISFDGMAINMINQAEASVTVPYVFGINVPGCHPGDVLPLLGSVSGELIRTRSGLIIQTEDRNELQTRFPTLLTAFDVGLRTVIAVPLISKDQVIGAIHFRSAKSNAYSDQDLRIAESIGRQIGGAVANAQFYVERKRAEEEREGLFNQVRAGRERLRSLAQRLVESQEAERRDLVRRLHDEVGQNLTGLSINLNILRDQLPEETATKMITRIDDSLKLVEETVERIRDVMAELRPPVLDDYGVAAALHWYGKQFSERTAIATVLQLDGLSARLPSHWETALFRIAQEALTNVAKYAHAKTVTVMLEELEDSVRLTIADDGIGFNPEAHHQPGAKPEWGLMNMRERAQAIGGKLAVETAPGKGTRIVVEVPKKH